MNCEICDYVAGRVKARKLYEDAEVMAIFNPKPAVFGHAIVFPKKHLTILQQIPEETAKKMFLVSQQLAGIIFESLGAEGTNIMLNEGVPAGQKHAHAVIHVIPRKKDDGLSFEWAQKQIPEDSMAKIYELLKVPQEMKVEKPAERPKEPEGLKKEGALGKAREYLLKHLRRIP